MFNPYHLRKLLFSLKLLVLSSLILVSCSKPGINVLVIDGFSNHDWSYTTEVITSMLEKSGLCQVDISTVPLKNDQVFKEWSPDFSKYDVVVQNTNSYGNGHQWPESARKDFENYMKNGGGLYVFHSGNNAFAEWEEYNRMIGLGWRNSDQGEAIEIIDGQVQRIPSGVGEGTSHGPRRTLLVERLTDHPINNGCPDKWMTPDIELYVYARGPAENLEVLSYTYDSITGKKWPVDWIVEYGKGRVYNGTFGHLWHDRRMPESIQCVGFQTTFIRAMQWLAGQKPSLKIPENFPTRDAISIQPFDLVYRDRDGWASLYNGRNLEGWDIECLPEEREMEYWTSEGDYIQCNSIGRGNHSYFWLINEGEYDDFQLRLEFQAFKKSPGNSGVQFRSRWDKTDGESEGGWLNGPQFDIHPPNPFRCGLIYDETRENQRWIYPSLPNWAITPAQAPEEAQNTELVYADDDPSAWNSMELICQGMEIRTFVNGKRILHVNADGILNDENHLSRRVGVTGNIALQLHLNDELLIRFRNIYIRDLDHGISNR